MYLYRFFIWGLQLISFESKSQALAILAFAARPIGCGCS
jgi:hypothetical protein